ncbi:single-stranded DNA-binding protein [Pseudoxanthomonas sp. SE1]|uniref:single-stranded DNA-binding protein n=1 Tax=Pseudoxanthomonas sp. SE1 TaxID=1664560 RepID=UPI00240E81B6|nr:single-stranded DNA-binding protein [Pseudoxanthomonas sp. SE1]WFC43785.1 single-stranded DNA-binding protein [Pseudoxanthomonas sp. SE1]
MSGIKVTVLEETPIERSGTFDGRDGEQISYTTRKQKAKLEAGGFAYPLDVRLEEGQKAYPKGDYTLDLEAMITVNKGVINLSKFTALKSLASAKV